MNREGAFRISPASRSVTVGLRRVRIREIEIFGFWNKEQARRWCLFLRVSGGRGRPR